MYEHTTSANVFEMNKKVLFLFCALFVGQIKSDSCSDDFFKCFSELADSFFKNIPEIEHIDTSESIPGFKQVKDVELRSIAELTQSIQDELFKQIQSHVVDDAVVVTDNPKTQIQVKTFSHYYFEDSFLPNLENINPESDENETDKVNKDQIFTPLEAKTVNVESDGKDVSEQFTIQNQIPEDIVTLLNQINDQNHKALSEETKIININNSSLKDLTNTSKEQKTTIEDTSPRSAELIDSKNKDAIKQVTYNHSSVTPVIQIKQKTDYKPLANHTEKNEEKLSQKELGEKQSNYKHTRQNEPNDNTENLLTDKQFEKDIRENIIQTDDDNDYDTEDATDYPQIDYIDLYKDTTNEENVYVPTESPKAVIDIKEEIVENVEEYSLEIDTDLNNYTYVSLYTVYFINNIIQGIIILEISDTLIYNQQG